MALQVSNTGQAMFLGDIEAAAPDDGLEQDFAPKRSPSYLLVQFTLQFTPAAAWLAVATSRYVIGLDQQSYLGLGLVTAYTSSELVLLGTSRYVRVDDGSPMEAFVRAVLVHGLAAWYLVLHHVQAAAADPIANSALMYASLVLVGTFGWLAHWRLRADKLAALAASAQAKELRVQYDALRKLVKGGLGYFSDSEEEDGGDQREHLIKPPASIMLSAGAFGKPELAFTEALHGLSFDRELALRIAAQIRRKHYTLDRFYSDVQVCALSPCTRLAETRGGRGGASASSSGARGSGMHRGGPARDGPMCTHRWPPPRCRPRRAAPQALPQLSAASPGCNVSRPFHSPFHS